jgi:hypothetical protein
MGPGNEVESGVVDTVETVKISEFEISGYTHLHKAHVIHFLTTNFIYLNAYYTGYYIANIRFTLHFYIS